MSSAFVEFAPAKINLALHVLGRRADGYHELDSIVAFASVGDVLEVSKADQTTLTVDGPFAQDVPLTDDNLVLKAHAALSAHIPLPPVAMRLTKNLPVASGIGGGSADAAAALRCFLRLATVQPDAKTLERFALSLGADVPVCLRGTACRMQGVGEVMTDISVLPAKAIVLANPLQPCGTADVFRKMGLKAGDRFGSPLDVSTSSQWRNDMTAAAIGVLPVIADVLAAMKRIAPLATVRMSGSGATCFAMFDTMENASATAAKMSADYPQWWTVAAVLS